MCALPVGPMGATNSRQSSQRLFWVEFSPRDFPGGPSIKILSSRCREPKFDPWSGN